MLLSNSDVKRLEMIGYTRLKFVHYDKHGFASLRNRQGFCVFYDPRKHRCEVYEHRPAGCRIYPVVHCEPDEVVVDDVCPRKDTVTAAELARKSVEVRKLLRRIDSEAASRRSGHWNRDNVRTRRPQGLGGSDMLRKQPDNLAGRGASHKKPLLP